MLSYPIAITPCLNITKYSISQPAQSAQEWDTTPGMKPLETSGVHPGTEPLEMLGVHPETLGSDHSNNKDDS